MSNATPAPTTGEPYIGTAAAAVSVFANNIPVVACKPIIVAPRPMIFTVKPVDNVRMTSVRGGTKSKSFAPLRSLSPNRTMPSDQNVVKNPAHNPNRMKYNPASVDFVKPLYKNENTTITAATVVSTSCAQNPARPSDLHALLVRATFREMFATASSSPCEFATISSSTCDRTINASRLCAPTRADVAITRGDIDTATALDRRW
mmetsp:Transcript_3902/g.14144  ORF Transcript_3902/g.14144 Transcript_3902/m.14144 type:complete len:204 (+) Transcript_3902:159-770(+)